MMGRREMGRAGEQVGLRRMGEGNHTLTIGTYFRYLAEIEGSSTRATKLLRGIFIFICAVRS